MANKKLSELTTKTSIGSSDLFPIADATTGQLYKKTVYDLAVAIGGGVSSVNTLTGVVVLNADNIAEASSPTNKYFTDLRARGAISAGTGISYNSSTGVITNTGQPLSTNLTSLAGLTYTSASFVKMTASGTFSLDTNIYLTVSSAASQYQAIGNYSTGFGTATRIPRWTTSSAFGLAQIWDDGTNVGIGATPGSYKLDITGTLRVTDIATFSNSITANSFIKSGGSSSQFLKADGSVDSTTYKDSINSFNRQTASYTLVLGDKDKVVEMNVASANTLTVPTNTSVAFPIGTEISIMQYGAGAITVTAASGVTIRSRLGYLRIVDQYTGGTLLKVGTNEWYLIGNLAS
jgi:hypothetical protein